MGIQATIEAGRRVDMMTPEQIFSENKHNAKIVSNKYGTSHHAHPIIPSCFSSQFAGPSCPASPCPPSPPTACPEESKITKKNDGATNCENRTFRVKRLHHLPGSSLLPAFAADRKQQHNVGDRTGSENVYQELVSLDGNLSKTREMYTCTYLATSLGDKTTTGIHSCLGAVFPHSLQQGARNRAYREPTQFRHTPAMYERPPPIHLSRLAPLCMAPRDNPPLRNPDRNYCDGRSIKHSAHRTAEQHNTL